MLVFYLNIYSKTLTSSSKVLFNFFYTFCSSNATTYLFQDSCSLTLCDTNESRLIDFLFFYVISYFTHYLCFLPFFLNFLTQDNLTNCFYTDFDFSGFSVLRCYCFFSRLVFYHSS